MSEHLSPHERALLDALQRDDTPDVGAQRRVKQQLFAELGLGVAGGALIAGATATSHAAPASGIVATGTTQLAGQLATQSAANVATHAAATTGTAGTLGAASAGASTAGGLAALAAKLGTAKVVLGLTAALATAGGTALWSRANAPEATTVAAVVASDQAAHVSPTPPEPAALEVAAAPLPEVKAVTPSRSRVASSRSSLEDEAQLLAQAQQKISQGDARGALSVLSEHQREFPRGTLSLERQATFAIARCLAGQTTRGRADAVRFRRQHPNSPMVKRLESACQLPAP
jgi:hypothetical protein